MKKKLLCLSALVLSACMSFSQTVLNVNAIYEGSSINAKVINNEPQVSLPSAASSWGSLNLEGTPKPPAGTQLVYSDTFNLSVTTHEDNLFCFVLASGSYKILSYDAGQGIVYGTTTATGHVDADPEFGIPAQDYTYETLSPYVNSADLGTILANEPVRTENTSFKTCANPEGYILLFKDNAKSAKDLKYACKISDLANYLKTVDYSTPTPSVNQNAKYNVELVDKIYEPNSDYCISAKFKVTFDLGQDEKATCIIIDNSDNLSLGNESSGELEFELNNLENKTYEYYISSMNGNKYAGTFIVDFATDFGEEYKPEINDLVPEVTFEGYPESKVSSGTSVTMKMNTLNVDSLMNFDGVSLGNGRYGKSFEFTVKNNGDYYYVASTAGGKYIEGTLKIDFFEGDYVYDESYVGDDSDPINKSLTDGITEDIEGVSTNVASTTTSLAKTGIETSTIIFVVAGILVFLGVVLLIVRKNKGGAHRNE